MDVEVENADKVLPQMNEKEGTEEVANSEYDEEEKNVTQSYTRDESNEVCYQSGCGHVISHVCLY